MGAAGRLPGHFVWGVWHLFLTLSTPIVLWHNNLMPRWLFPLIAGVLGVAVGLVYGWVLNPVKFVDTTPGSLRADYRADYVLMVAESYEANQDATLASRRLAIFGTENPSNISQSALDTAERAGFSQADILLMQNLTRAMQAYQPVPATAGSAP